MTLLQAIDALCGRINTAMNTWHVQNKRAIVNAVEPHTAADKLVIVPAKQLDDVLELARACGARLPEFDPLRMALAGAVAAIRCSAILEP